MSFSIPRITISALRGGSGKTILSLGLASAWSRQGLRVASFKKGPDFIDADWLSFASGRACRNLDAFMLDEAHILESFITHSGNSDVALIEGNRGLYDGMDLNGTCSTAELAKLVGSPTVIIIDVTMATRTLAAVVRGCQVFDPDVHIAGVILNRVGGPRQESLVRKAVEKYCDIRVVGSVPKLQETPFQERHMGLVPCRESGHAGRAVSWARSVVEQGIDLEGVLDIAREHARALPLPPRVHGEDIPVQTDSSPRIGFILDKSFWFYYPENIEQLKKLGATLVEINAISDHELPALDALYVGGGFPECRARDLADNLEFRHSLKQAVEGGLPVYAECGGLIYMGTQLFVDGEAFPMVGALPIEFELIKKPQGHGYTVMEVDRANPYFPEGEILKGHEFHYSRAVYHEESDTRSVFKVLRGSGLDGLRDGVCRKNLLATYTHIHAAGNSLWAQGLVKAALAFQKNGK